MYNGDHMETVMYSEYNLVPQVLTVSANMGVLSDGCLASFWMPYITINYPDYSDRGSCAYR